MQKQTLGIISASLLGSCMVAACDDTMTPEHASSNVAALAASAAGSGARSTPAPDGAGRSAGLADSAPALRVVYTEHLGQLTDRPPNSFAGLGMTGTDLGVSYQHADKLYFLFGDAWTTSALDPNRDLDSIASASAAPLDGGIPRLTWVERGNGQFQSFSLPGISLRGMSVPVEGVAIDDRDYLFFHTGWDDRQQRGTVSALAHAERGDFASLTLDHAVKSDKFMSVSVVRQGDQLWIFGAGNYRHSAVYLARVDAGTLTDRTSWRYYRGPGLDFAADESSAAPVVDEQCVGELSVRKHERLDAYLMTYNCAEPGRGVVLRTSKTPSGPWSESLTMLALNAGDEQYAHADPQAVGHDDGLNQPDRADRAGSLYGPYMVPAWFTEPAPGLHAIVYTLSTWNPYQVQLMRTLLAEPGADAEPPHPGAGLPRAALNNADFSDPTLAGWTGSGDAFRSFADAADGGKAALTTYTADTGNAATGKLWQDFDIDAQTSRLSFRVHGGHGAVSLYEGDVLLRRSQAHGNNTDRSPVVWDLEPLRGKHVRLQIEDDATDTWGFIGVSGFTLE
jgi:hypothetical protein